MIVSALILGLLGSLHCVGMCGPIALALPVGSGSAGIRIWRALLYNIGRSLTYSVFGVAAGSVGATIAWAGGQQVLSVVLGSLILLGLVLSMFGNRIPAPKSITALMTRVKNQLARLFKNGSGKSIFGIGLLNGLLPCGLVYTALAGATAAGTWTDGALFMFLFGMGTAPAMTGLILAGNSITIKWRERLRRAVPVFVGIMALLLVLRGLGLGIPLISPEFAQEERCVKAACCH